MNAVDALELISRLEELRELAAANRKASVSVRRTIYKAHEEVYRDVLEIVRSMMVIVEVRDEAEPQDQDS